VLYFDRYHGFSSEDFKCATIMVFPPKILNVKPLCVSNKEMCNISNTSNSGLCPYSLSSYDIFPSAVLTGSVRKVPGFDDLTSTPHCAAGWLETFAEAELNTPQAAIQSLDFEAVAA
jgi:hypothetical protein